MLLQIKSETHSLFSNSFWRLFPMDDAPGQPLTDVNRDVVNVLIVDDDSLVLDTLCYLVTSMGYKAHPAKDGL